MNNLTVLAFAWIIAIAIRPDLGINMFGGLKWFLGLSFIGAAATNLGKLFYQGACLGYEKL